MMVLTLWQPVLAANAVTNFEGNSIYVNEQTADSALAPLGGQLRQADSLEDLGVVVEKENVTTLTNNINTDNSFTAFDPRYQIRYAGFSKLRVAILKNISSPLSSSIIGAMAVISDSAVLTSSYELTQGKTVTHTIYYQIPDGYSNSDFRPLLVGIHGFSGSGSGIRNLLAAEANNRGWVLVAPEMHNNFGVHPGDDEDTGQYALAWIGAQHDVMDTIDYMVTEYPGINTDKIYITGGSMGGMTTLMMAGKYPDIFAAAAPWKPITNLEDWYVQVRDSDPPLPGKFGIVAKIRREIDPNCDTSTDTDRVKGCGTPFQEPFEYERRSPIEMPYNSRLMPMHDWHAVGDNLVVITHSYNLINTFNPLRPTPPSSIVLDEVETTCADGGKNHCYNPPPLVDNFGLPATDLFDFLANKTRSSTAPSFLRIRTDESKAHYWLNISQTGNAHWSEVEATYTPASQTVTAVVTDVNPLTLGFNLGSPPISGPVGISQSGLGMAATLYEVTIDNDLPYLEPYTPNTYLTVMNVASVVTITVAPVGNLNERIYLPAIVKND